MFQKLKIYTATVIYLLVIWSVKGWETVVNSRFFKKFKK